MQTAGMPQEQNGWVSLQKTIKILKSNGIKPYGQMRQVLTCIKVT
uniref:Uncharacterized protein n=1 Tax=Anguilla anguilla TaxID=7936 RepID=A0A0E9QTI6_ANGAN